MTRADIRSALVSQHEIALTATLYGEARGESVAGQIAVANVVGNRARSSIQWWGRDIAGVCLAPQQFSCWLDDDPNAVCVFGLAESLLSGAIPPDLAIVRQLRWIASGVIAGAVRDITGHADHYLTTDLLQRKPPAWAVGRQPVKVIDRHSFFRLYLPAGVA